MTARWGGRPSRRIRATVLQEEDLCCICGRPVDKTLSGNHPLGPTVDHRTPRSHGGTDDRTNLALAHQRCNSSRGNRIQRQHRRTSRQW